ncbi:MAG TPA: aminotransferase class V-fold PLP-dependent enzyme [Burkholderiales bacterium]|nr:aminotransferase class V-fold PLP-dependent enzyme [Burkholderiales bacterium]
MSIEEAVAALGRGPLEEDALKRHVWPLFSRVLRRSERDVYLANHSLGRPLDRTAQDLGDAIAAWYAELGGAWGQWLADRERFRALVARLFGAARPDCIVPKSSAGQGLRAVLNAYDKPLRVVTTEGEFDSLDIILRTYRDRGRVSLDAVPARADGRFHIDDIAARVVRGVDLVVLSHVMFRTAQLIEAIEALARHAHDARARLLLDVYHSAGVVPLDLHALKVDFAVGGSYKYLRGGPGACWLYVHPDVLKGGLGTLDIGWFAKRDAFAHLRPEPPQLGSGGDAWLESTPPVFSYAQARAGLEFAFAIGVPRLRAYSLAQQGRLIEQLAARGIEAQGARRDHGAFVVVSHPQAANVARELGRRGITVDARGDALRLGPDILNSDAELQRAAEALRAALPSA